MTKRQLQKLATLCANDVAGRIISSEAPREDYALIVSMVVRRLESFAAKSSPKNQRRRA